MLVRANANEIHDADPNSVLHLIADTETVTSNRSVFRDGSDGAPPHFHTRASEMFYVLGGELEMLVDDQVLTLTKGDFLLVPPRTPHAFGAVAGKDADVLCVFTPGMGRFDYYRLLDRVQRGEADPKEIAASSQRFDNHYFESPLWKKTRERVSPGGA
ncbi:cupin domain-containing protein [Actinocorallia longicatena]|uniref:Cupin domain-containing protein n=1 Tax=Actinocorallia longicatena TaxID=111803 RepID=A0ABP6QAC2_9ACTN